jgi:glycerophosphoryl diester phosphodiesterase
LLFIRIDAFAAPAPRPERVEWLKQWCYAHRGLHGPGVPENSLAAASEAIEAGLGIECDVQKSSDGQALVFHDWQLDRLTGEAGPVAERAATQLNGVGLSGSDGEHIPTLPELLALVHGRVPLLIEVKSKRERRPAPLCMAVRRALEGYAGKVAVMSFDPRVARWFAEHAPHIVRGLVVTEENERTLSGAVRRHMSLWHARPDFLAYDVRDLPSRFASAQRERGLPVLTWTVRSAELRERAAQYADASIAEGAGVEPGHKST